MVAAVRALASHGAVAWRIAGSGDRIGIPGSWIVVLALRRRRGEKSSRGLAGYVSLMSQRTIVRQPVGPSGYQIALRLHTLYDQSDSFRRYNPPGLTAPATSRHGDSLCITP